MKVATFNISHCQDFSITTADDAPVNIEKYAKYIDEMDADVLVLNEVYFKGVEDCFNEQVKKLNVYEKYPYTAEGVGKDLGWATIGNAILSKYPIEKVECLSVLAPDEAERRVGENEWYEDRVVVCVTLNVKGKQVRVMGTHFGLNVLEKERMLQVLCPKIDDADMPVILMGDFNARPHTDILMPLYKRLVSCADVLKNTDYTFSSFEPYCAIDYIFASKNIEVKGFEVKKDILSDHRACCAILEL